MTFVVFAVMWIWIGIALSKRSPQPDFVKSAANLMAISEVARLMDLVLLDRLLTVISLALVCVMFVLRSLHEAKTGGGKSR